MGSLDIMGRMVKGIEIDDSTYKHKKRDDVKWLSEDLNIIRKITEGYIDSIRPDGTRAGEKKVLQDEHVLITPVRVFEILLLGLLGPIVLIGGFVMFMNGYPIVSIPVIFIGLVMVIALVLNEIYRKKL